MKKIAIVLGSIRIARQSPKVALFFKEFISKTNLANAEIIDLKEYQFPLFEERLRYLQNPAQNILDFATKIKEADAIIMVSPEYNGSFPASVKNVIDLLKDEWFHKPIGLATVSAGNFGGLKCQIALQQTLQHMRALVSPAVFPVPNVETEFDENGIPADADKTNKRAEAFVKELLWLCEKK